MTRRYLHLDVFTATPYAGNQLAVVLDAQDLQPSQMQAIANEMAFSETTFVLPARDAAEDWQVRIFTPHRELPMAGHPTIGTCFALAATGLIAAGTSAVTLGLGIGPTRVRLQWQAAALAFAWMQQPVPEFGAQLTNQAAVAQALALPTSALDHRAPMQQVSSGVPFLFVALQSKAAVDAAALDRTALAAVYTAAGLPELPVYLCTVADGLVYSRMFAPSLGVPEDPATGGANGPLGAYLLRYGLVPASQAGAIHNRQGVKMGRPSDIHIQVALDAMGNACDVQVGGQAVLVAQGQLLR